MKRFQIALLQEALILVQKHICMQYSNLHLIWTALGTILGNIENSCTGCGQFRTGQPVSKAVGSFRSGSKFPIGP